MVTTSGFPQNLAITPDGSKIYVTSAQAFHTGIIDTATNTLEGTSVNTGGTTKGIAITGTSAYVANGSGAANFFDINTSTNISTTVTGVALGPTNAVAILPNGSKLYIGSTGTSAKVYVMTTSNNTKTATIFTDSDGTGASYPRGIAITPDGSKAYTSNGYKSTVSVINTSTDLILGSPIILGAIGMDVTAGIAINTAGTKAYVAYGSNVKVIDTLSDTVIGSPITIGGSPQGIAIAVLPNPKPPSPAPMSTPNPMVSHLVDEVIKYTKVSPVKGSF